MRYALKNNQVSFTDYDKFLSVFGPYFGLNVSSKKFVGWVADCLDIWGKYFGKAKFRLYDEGNDNKEVEKHPILDLFKSPNTFQTRWEILYRMACNFGIDGDSFLLKLRDGLNVPREVIQLTPHLVEIKSSKTEFIDHYIYNTGTERIRLEKSEVIHFRYPDPHNQVKGLPIISRILDQIEVDKFQTAYQKQFYKAGGFLGTVFSTDQKLGDKQFERAEKNLQEKYGGDINNSYKVALFEQGLKPVSAMHTIKDMEITGQRNLTKQEIMAAFQVSKVLMGEAESINRANADTAIYQFTSGVVDPVLNYVDEVFTKELAQPDFHEDYYIRHDILAPRDEDAVLKYYENGRKYNWLSPNQIIEMEGLPISTEEGADSIFAKINSTSKEEKPKEDEA